MTKFLLGFGVGLLISMPILTFAATNLASKLSGKILLQVESKGEAWYVNPSDGKRYYMANGNEAYNIMRKLGLGITNKDLNQIPIAINNSAQTPSTVKSYKTIKTFSGNGNFNSQDFNITGEKFKIIWTHTGKGNFTMATSNKEDEASTCWIGNVIGNWSAYDVCMHGKGDFNLTVITEGSWTAEVQDYK